MKPDAYTIGNQISYERFLSTEVVTRKLGQRDEYEGGWVWRTAHEAQMFITTTDLTFPAKVYGLILPTDWDTDVSPFPSGDGVHRLINDAQIIRLSNV